MLRVMNALTNPKNLALLLLAILNINTYSSDSILKVRKSPIVVFENTGDSSFIPYNLSTTEGYEAYLEKLKVNLSDSIPIAEYCVAHEKKLFQDCFFCETFDSTNVYLRLKEVLQEQPNITVCGAGKKDNFKYKADFYWANTFLIHDDLKTERIKKTTFSGSYFVRITGECEKENKDEK